MIKYVHAIILKIRKAVSAGWKEDILINLATD